MVKKFKIKDSFIGNVLTLITGTTFAQALPIIASPILTRLFTPEEFGELGLFIAVLGILSVLGCMRYDLAIALPKEDKDAINLLTLSILIATLFGFILLILNFILNMSSFASQISHKTTIILWFLPVAVCLMGIFQALLNWSIRTKKFKLIAFTQFYRASTVVTGQVGVGLLLNGSLILIFSQILGQLVANINMFKRTIDDFIRYKDSITKNNIKKQLIRYKKFPLFYSWSALLNTTSVQLPLFMLAFFFNPVIVGFYTLANRVLAAPITIIGNAIAQPYLQKASEEYRENRLGVFSLQIFKVLLRIGLVPIILLSIISPELFGLIFGPEWSKAGNYVQLLSVWLLFVFISSPLSHIFTILELQKESLYFNMILFLSRITVLIIGGLTGNDIFTIALFGITGGLLWLYQITWLLKKTGINSLTTIKSICKEFLLAMPFFLALIIIKILINNILIILLGTLIILIFFIFIRFKKNVLKLF